VEVGPGGKGLKIRPNSGAGIGKRYASGTLDPKIGAQ